VLALTDIIAFLLDLLGDDAARAEFEADPDGTLERAGLDGVTAQDIRDARLQLADSGAVSATDDGADDPYFAGDDPVREIGYTTRHYAAEEPAHASSADVDHADTFVTIDDRDTLFFQSISDDDVTVTDNSVSITDSFNQDNSDDDLVAIQDNDTSVTVDSFNEDNDLTAVQDNDVDIDVTPPGAASAPEPPAVDDAPAADLADAGTDDGETDTDLDADLDADLDDAPDDAAVALG
jgi:hypothetical protein